MAGIGLPTTSVAALSQIIDPRIAIVLVVFPIMMANAWQVYREGKIYETFLRYRLFAIILMLCLWVTTFFTARISPSVLILMIGITVVIFAVTSLTFTMPKIPDRFDTLGQSISGFVAGVLGGLTSIWSPPLVIYFMARRLDKDEFVRASGLLIFLGSLPLGFGFWQAGMFTADYAQLSLLMLVPTFIGFSIGEYFRRRLNTERFRQIVLLIFLFMGLNLIRRALF